MAKEQPVEAWVLMALVHKDLDDFDYRNALLLAERLYAIDKSNEDYRLLYGKCLYLMNDYNGTYSVLQGTKSVPCVYLFARSCLELGNRQVTSEKQRLFWSDGCMVLLEAIKQCESEPHCWGDELGSITTRSHFPSKSSMYHVLGELYTKLENIRAAAMHYQNCLRESPFKLASYTQLCDIAPDAMLIDPLDTVKELLRDFSSDNTRLERGRQKINIGSPNPALTGEMNIKPERDHGTDTGGEKHRMSEELEPYMPSLRDAHSDIPLEQLRAIVLASHPGEKFDVEREVKRYVMEKIKQEKIDEINSEIEKLKADEAYKNKHGLYKKPPPEERPQQLEVELMEELNLQEPQQVSTSVGSPPRPTDIENQSPEGIAQRVKRLKRTGESIEPSASSKKKERKEHSPASLYNYFVAENSDKGIHENEASRKCILEAMNKVLATLRVIAKGYRYQSAYKCRDAVLELQRLDDKQYDTPSILCILGKAYYHVGDYQMARVFFRRSFCIAPWYCDGVPIYSTCLWYLEKEHELNLLAYKMKENRSHLYEAYIAAGNWSKCSKGGNEASKWFQKAVDLDPTQSYGHALLGYEEWEKGNSLGAKTHFANCMALNKRSYLGWYGMATAYQRMEQYYQARGLLLEAIRLHPCHPVLLSTMAEVLLALKEYQDAHKFVCLALQLRKSPVTENLKERIQQEMANPPAEPFCAMEEDKDT